MTERPVGERPKPHLECPACGATPFTPHVADCPWLVFSPPSWREEPVQVLDAAKLGLDES